MDWAMVVCTQHSPAVLPDATPLGKAWLTISEDMKAKLISLPARQKEYEPLEHLAFKDALSMFTIRSQFG